MKEIPAVVEPLVLDEPSLMGAEAIDPDEDDNVDSNEVIDSDETADEVIAPRRSGRIRNRPDYHVEGVAAVTEELDEPTCYQDAVSSPKRIEWKKAMEAKMHSLKKNNVWELVELPENHKVVGSKTIYKIKFD